MALEGNLETFYLSSLFQLLSNDKKTGRLRIVNDADVVTVTFSDGTIICAASTENEKHLGYLLRSEGVIGNDELEKHLHLARSRGHRLGKVLVDEYYISKEELKNYIRQQAENILFSLFMWTSGKFRFEECDVTASDETDTQFDTMELILEASRRVDEISVLEKQIPSRDHVLRLGHEIDETEDPKKLTPHENAILRLVDGSRPIREIIFQSGYDEFTVFKSLYTLLSTGIIEVSDKIELVIQKGSPEPEKDKEEVKVADQPPALTLEPLLGDKPLVEPAPPVGAAAETNDKEPAPGKPPETEPAAAPVDAAKSAKSAPAIAKADTGFPSAAEESLERLKKPEKKLHGRRPYATAILGTMAVVILLGGAYFYKQNKQAFDSLLTSTPVAEPVKAPQPPPAAVEQEDYRPDKAAPLPKDLVVDTQSVQDTNSFFFMSLPMGFMLKDMTKPRKSHFKITYSQDITLEVIARPFNEPWKAEDAMYNKIVDFQTGKAEGIQRAVETYSLLTLGGGKGYELTASGNVDAVYCKTQLYTLVGYDKMITVQLQCRDCNKPKIYKLFSKINDAVKKSLLIYP